MKTTKLEVLCVDDEIEVLNGLRMILRRNYNVTVTESAHQALEYLKTEKYSIILSDMRMPEMNGADFLAKAKRISPNSVRMLLTGYSDLNAAIDAINKGQVYRFLTKPCPPDQLLNIFDDAAHQYSLITAEKELLHKTLKGSVTVLAEILSIVDPETADAVSGLRSVLVSIAKELEYAKQWDLEIAYLISSIGIVTIPSELRQKAKSNEALTEDEADLIGRVPEIGAKLISHIPRMETVAEIVRYQAKNFDGSGFPRDSVRGDKIPLGSRILRILKDYDLAENIQKTDEWYKRLKTDETTYDPDVVKVFIKYANLLPTSFELVEIDPRRLRTGDRLIDPVTTDKGRLLLAAGMRINQPILEKLHHYASIVELQGQVRVERPK